MENLNGSQSQDQEPNQLERHQEESNQGPNQVPSVVAMANANSRWNCPLVTWNLVPNLVSELKAEQKKRKNREMEERTRQLNEQANGYRNSLVMNGSSSQVYVAASVENSTMSQGIQQLLLVERPNVRWDDVIGHDYAKEALYNAVVLPLTQPHLFQNKNRKRNILLVGPPGCGKTELARAVATEAERYTFFNVSNSDIFSRYVGDPEKKVAELFEAAEQSKPAIIFIDEIDAICRSRGDEQADVDRRVLTEILSRLDGIRSHSQSGIVLIGATNVPWDLDDAMLRRFQEMIHVGLPDAEAREKLFKLHLGSTPNTLTEDEFKTLGDNTHGFSGSDIKAIVNVATRGPLRKARSSRHFKQVNDGFFSRYLACDENDAGAEGMNFDQVPQGRLAVHPVTFDDVREVISGRKPSVSTNLLEKLDKFHENHGH